MITRPEGLGPSDTAPRPEHRSPSQFFTRQLERTPWWMVSISVHALLLGILLMIPWHRVNREEVIELTTGLEPPVKRRLTEVEPRPADRKPIPVEERRRAERKPQTRDEREETVDDRPADQASGEPDSMASLQLASNRLSAALGMRGGGLRRFGQRTAGGRARATRRGGGDPGVLRAADLGLDWLARHQGPHGGWGGREFQRACRGGLCTGAGSVHHDVGVSSLALLAFLGAGSTHLEGKYRAVVGKGVRYLTRTQRPDGALGEPGAPHFMYDHAIGAQALAEAFGMTRSPMVRAHAQRSVDFLCEARNRGTAWRYQYRRGDSDTSVTGWALLALKSAKVAGLRIDAGGLAGARAWLDALTDDRYHRTGYMRKGDRGARLTAVAGRFAPNEAMTAVALFSRLWLGVPRREPVMIGAASLLEQDLPARRAGARSGVDYYYWYYGSLAMYQMGGRWWSAWNRRMMGAIMTGQRRSGCERGSWDAIDPWGAVGGRVYSTAINVLSLEVYYRYDRV